MTAHVGQYPPRSPRATYPRPSPSQTAGHGNSLAQWALAFLGLTMLVATTLPRSSTPAAAVPGASLVTGEAISAPVQFSVQAQGMTERAVPLFDAPGSASPREQLPSGATIEIGGQLRVASGLGLHALNWVRFSADDGAHYGFVSADAVRIIAGEPALLDSSDLRPERWSRPEAAASYSGGEALTAAGVAAEGDDSAVTASSAAGQTTPTIAWLPQSVGHWWPEITRIAARHHVDPELVAIIVLVESGGDTEARSHAGAAGLMQLMPATAREVAQQLGMGGFNLAMLSDPTTNIELGTSYIAQQLARFGQDSDPDWQNSVELAAAAYNGGPGTVQAMTAGSRALPAETKRYVDWVGGMWRDRRLAESTTFSRWWWAGGQRLVQNAERRVASSR